ncbi:hypothetical protein [Lichenibacterium ramalinae]|nr:hypothetical protein [Lichenibacterium ramalinae]
MSTRHRPDGAMDTPTAILLSAEDEGDAIDQARRYPLENFVEAADYAWLVDGSGTVVCAFAVAANRAA